MGQTAALLKTWQKQDFKGEKSKWSQQGYT